MLGILQAIFDKFNSVLGHAVAGALHDYLNITIDEEGAWKLLVGSLGLLLPATVPFLHRFFKQRVGLYRCLLDDRQKLSGFWVETISKNDITYVTVSEMYYDRKAKDYRMEFNSFDDKCAHHATLHTHMISHEIQDGSFIELLYRGTYSKTARRAIGYARFEYNRGYKDGTGHIVDFELDENETMRQTIRLSFRLHRLKGREIRSILKSKRVHTNEHRARIARHFLDREQGLESTLVPKRLTRQIEDINHGR
jgi:hypothetical protein